MDAGQVDVCLFHILIKDGTRGDRFIAPHCPFLHLKDLYEKLAYDYDSWRLIVVAETLSQS